MNQILLNIIAAIAYYLFPILVGRGLILMLNKKLNSKFNLLKYYAIGALVLYGLMLGLTGFISMLDIANPAFVLRTALIVILSGFGLLNLLPNKLSFRTSEASEKSPTNIEKIRRSLSVSRRIEMTKFAIDSSLKSWILPVGLSLGLATMAFSIWKLNSPYPLFLNWDVFEHQTLINYIKSGQLNWAPSAMSDTFQFNSYSSIYHVILTVPQIIFSLSVVEGLGFWWIVEYFHFALTILVSYILAKTISNNRTVAANTAIISAFVFESYVVYSSLFLMPQTAVAVWVVLTLAYVIEKNNRRGTNSIISSLSFRDTRSVARNPLHNRISHFANAPFEMTDKLDWSFLPILVFIFISHYIIGLAGLLIVGAIYILLKLNLNERKYLFGSLLILLPIVIYFGLNTISSINHLDTLNAGEAALYTFSLAKKFEYSRAFYGYSWLILLPLGILAAAVSKNKLQKIFLLVALVVLAVVLSNFPYALKFYVLGRYLVHVLMALGLAILVNRLNPAFKALGLTVIMAAFLSVFILNGKYWKDPILYRYTATELSYDEIKATQFLAKKYTGQNALIVSDPSTSYALEAFSGVNSPGGAFMQVENRKLIESSFAAANKDEFLQNIYQVRDSLEPTSPEIYLYVVSGRLAKWMEAREEERLSIGFNVWKPQELAFADLKKVAQVEADFGMKKVYQNPTLAIFEISGSKLGGLVYGEK